MGLDLFHIRKKIAHRLLCIYATRKIAFSNVVWFSNILFKKYIFQMSTIILMNQVKSVPNLTIKLSLGSFMNSYKTSFKCELFQNSAAKDLCQKWYSDYFIHTLLKK